MNTEPQIQTRADSLALWMHIIYGCYLGGFFSLGLAPVVGVIIAYLKQPDATGTFYESHIIWAIRTFWLGLLVMCTIGLIALIISFVPLLGVLGGLVLSLIALWYIYRIAKGWIQLSEKKPIENPQKFF